MPIRDKQVIPVIANAISGLALAYRDASPPSLKKYLRSTIGHMCRELEDFVEPRISVAAENKAKELGLSVDLRQCHWDDQTTKMKDIGRKIFHWEHIVTVGDLTENVLTLRSPSQEAVEEILRTADIAWILKAEDDRLDLLGYRSKRRDPMECYEKAEIRFAKHPDDKLEN